MSFSIIIPFYNVNEVYLEECLKSMSGQIDENDEVIIINDGSKYFPYNLLDKYKNMNIQYIEQENKGVSVARNVGIDKAKKPYIIFVDPDDQLYENAIHNFKSVILKKYDTDIILSYNKILMEGRLLPHTIDRSIKIPDSKHLIVSTLNTKDAVKNIRTGAVWAKAFRRGFLINNNIKFDESLRYSEDQLFMMQCYHLTDKISLIDEHTYIYRADNVSSACNHYNENIEENILSYSHCVDRFVKAYYEKDSEINEANSMMKLWSVSFLFVIKYSNVNKPKNMFIKNIRLFKKYLREINFYKSVKFKHAKLFGVKGKLTVFLIKTHQICLLFIIRMIVTNSKRLKNN